MGNSLFSSGGIVLLDYVLTPHNPISLYNPFSFAIFDGLWRVVGTDFSSKIIFIAILILAYYLGIFLTQGIADKFFLQKSKTIEIFMGIFFLVNPFAYERMMVQPTIYLGIILLGWLIYFLFFSKNQYKYIFAWIFAGIAINIFLHASFMVLLIFGVYSAFFLREKKELFQIFFSILIIFVLNINWIILTLFGASSPATSISVFSIANFEAFATQSLHPMNVWFTNIFLYGFWGERFSNHYVSVQFLSSLWFVAGVTIFVWCLLGIYILFLKNFKKFAYSFGIIFICSLVFGIGIASPLLRDFTIFMAEYIPFWQWYREPQKWIGVLMIVEGILFSIALLWIFQKLGKDMILRISACITIVLLLLIWSPGSLWGYNGQLKNSIFPYEYEQFRQQKISENFLGNILVFPWHSYLGCSWTGRPTIANPAVGLLSPLNVTVANNIEVGPMLYSNFSDEQTQNIEKFISEKDISFLNKTHFTHIFLMKNCASSQNFLWLDNLSQCQKIDDNSQLSFYQCQK